MYTNGHSDYGKRDMLLRKLLLSVRDNILESPTKDDMLFVLNMLYTGDLEYEYVPKPQDAMDNGIEYTGLDPVYFAPRIYKIFNRQIYVIGDLFVERYSGVDSDDATTIIRHYLLNSKKIVCDLPFPINMEEQNWILGYY